MSATTRRRKFWGWGWEGDGLSDSELASLAGIVAARLGSADLTVRPAPEISALSLRAPRLVAPPDSLAGLFSVDTWDRAEHTLGKSFNDLVRGFYGAWDNPPDMVAFPRSEEDVGAVLEWCDVVGAAVIPYGGGSSVAGGIEPDVGPGYEGAVSLDLRFLDRVLELSLIHI